MMKNVIYYISTRNYRVNARAKAKFAGVAQLVEQLICNQQVAGSSPITSSIKRDKLSGLSLIVWESSRAAKGGRL